MSPLASFFVQIEGSTQGPYTRQEIADRLTQGVISKQTLAWTEGSQGWLPASELLGPLSENSSTSQPQSQLPSSARVHSGEKPRYPWWSLAVCLLAGFAMMATSSRLSSIEREAIPYIREANRMNSTDYSVSAGLEAFLRGAQGDIFGKANEEYRKGARIEDKLAQLSADYDSAQSKAGFYFLFTISAGIIWLIRHLKFRQKAKRFHSETA